MTTNVALLRAVNVGGRKLVMSQLREAVEAAGYTDVSTYIQSGNVILSHPKKKAATIERHLAEIIDETFGLTTEVMVRTPPQLVEVLDQNPFAGSGTEASKLHVVFLKTAPAPGAFDRVDRSRFAPDELALVGRHLYIRYPNGAGRSKLTNTVIARVLGTPGTARNVNTVVKLLELAEATSS